MKTLLLPLILFSYSSFAGYGKPELLARYSGVDAFNAPDGLYCFGSEPQPSKEGVFLGCQMESGFVMMKWSPDFKIIASSENGNFSHPKDVDGKINWYEFSEAGVSKIFEYKNNALRTIPLKNLGSIYAMIDSFTAVRGGNYVYRLQEDTTKNLNLWSNNTIATLNLGEVGFIFPPTSSAQGDVLAKIRRNSIDESAPDELMIMGSKSVTVLKDHDADPASTIKAFRHQYALDNGAVALVVTDAQGEAMVILKDGKMTLVARAGKDLASFDYFSPKMRAGILLFRGADFQKRKVVYLYENGRVRPLLTQGDIISTDKGLARVHYQNQDAIFYGAPGIGPNGEIFQQATLTDADEPMTLLGIGLIKFKRE